MRAAKVTLLILSLIALSVFQVINRMTVNPTTSSGNGNPALLLGAVLIPIFILMVLLWVRVLRVHSVKIRTSLLGLLAISIHLVIAFKYHKHVLNQYREFIKNAFIEKSGTVDLQYVESITSFLGIHVNNQYFNLNTFFMFLTFSIFIAFAYHLWDLVEEKNNATNSRH